MNSGTGMPSARNETSSKKLVGGFGRELCMRVFGIALARLIIDVLREPHCTILTAKANAIADSIEKSKEKKHLPSSIFCFFLVCFGEVSDLFMFMVFLDWKKYVALQNSFPL